MRYKVFVRNGGTPATGLTLTWYNSRLRDMSDGSAISDDLPEFTERGDGIYTFDVTFSKGFLVADSGYKELAGWIDCSATIPSPAERYIPAVISVRDLAFTRQVNKQSFSQLTATETTRNDADDGDELALHRTIAGGVETRDFA